MTDVVDRLKTYSGQPTRDYCTLGATEAMLRDAIEEIERLRNERDAAWKLASSTLAMALPDEAREVIAAIIQITAQSGHQQILPEK